MKGKARGFLLLETALLGVFLVLLAGLSVLPRQMARLEARREARESALFLAQQELGELAARQKNFSAGTQAFGWLGPASDLAARPQDYAVTGTIEREAGGVRLRATVSWELENTPQEIELSQWGIADGTDGTAGDED